MQTALITGANRGIGLGLATKFLESGQWNILCCCRTPETADKLQSLKSSAPDRIEIYQLDVSDPKSINALKQELHGRPINLLLNNAGIMGGRSSSIHDVDFDAWEDALRINTIGPFRMVQAFVDNLKQSQNPRVVTISSQMGALNLHSTGAFAYRSSKAAVNKIMQTLSCEPELTGIIFTLFHPGWVQTDMGGASADITIEQSTSGLFDKIMSLAKDDNGKFFKWNGEEHPW
ncbi:SDR family oxidoreductase [Sneathiella sp.]|jgi:NAD(P)-dependent dehydrogenase (short-subunit alcohol dehydrogenase family)|uniref:SDR family oxidoreductase n=1 Tax=Sneathiella sp. TaxID=1964365 RepID=UPI0039E38843